MAAENGFLIEGVIYEIPEPDSFDMDELQTVFDYSGIRLEDLASSPDETDEERQERERKFDNPGWLRSLMHIAYQRENAGLKPDKVRALIGKAKVIDALSSLGDSDAEDDVLPPVQTTEPEPSSPSGSVESNMSSGNDSSTDTARPAAGLHRIGTGGSVTSSQESPTKTLVV